MRNAVGVFGLLCGLIVIGLVGRYGYRSTDIEADAWIMAFLFSAIAAGGLFGHAVATRLWRRNKAAALATGLISSIALLLNLSNSLGALAGRADRTTMERVHKNREIRAAEAELKRLAGLRAGMPPFVPTDASVVEAARRATERAEESRKAECGNGDPKQRGRHCRDRESDERTAVDILAKIVAAKAATDQAARLDAETQVQRTKLSGLGPVVVVNIQGSALAKLFRLPESEADFAATAQQFGIAAIVELIIVMCMVAWEVLSPRTQAPAVRGDEASLTNAKDNSRANLGREPEALLETPHARRPAELAALPSTVSSEPALPVAVTHPTPAERPTPPPRGKSATPRSRPRVTQNGARVAQVMTEALTPAKGGRVELGVGYLCYAAATKEEGQEPLDPDEFMDAMAAFCKGAGIRTRIDDNKLYLIDVELSRMQAT